MTEIFIPWNQNFGDIFATIQLLLRRIDCTGDPVYLSRWQNDTDLKPMMQDILRLLESSATTMLVIDDSKGNTKLSGYDVWQTPFYPTNKRWSSWGKHAYYAYQFDGVSSPELKNPPQSDINKIHDFLFPFPSIKVGLPMNAAASMSALAGCAFFVGVDSGMSHLAHSVGCPIFLLQYQLPVVTCHRGKPYILCEGADDLITKVQRYRDMLFTVGHPDGVRSNLPR